MFKVVPDQLRISEGWVRCGQCGEAFDASAHLQDAMEAADAAPSVDEAMPQPPSPPEPDAFDVTSRSSADDAADGVRDEVSVEAVAWIAPVSDDPTGLDPVAYPPALQATEVSTLLTDAPAPVSFMQETAVSATATGARRARWVWAIWATILLLGLLLQGLVHHRDRIAAWGPGFKPLVEAVCGLLQCQVMPWRDIEVVQIDSATFNKLRADVYRLSLSLKNAGDVDVALPAIELSLTDAQDEVLVRRVLLASELGAASAVLEAGSQVSVALALGMTSRAEVARIAGYRVLAFYP